MRTSVAVLIPVVTKRLSSSELISIKHIQKYLSDYQILYLTPPSLALPKELTTIKDYHIVEFNKLYFRSVKTYSQLLLSEEFYNKFLDYKYILIYQLDALVLRDELDYWVDRGYDYIGAPLINSKISWLTHPDGKMNVVGNGGFSLRKVSSHIETIRIQNAIADSKAKSPYQQLAKAVITGKSRLIWFKSIADKYPFNEDGFWSLEAPKINPNFKIAPLEDAQKFAWEKHSTQFFKKFGKLPFGVHAWQRYDEKFWLETLKS